MSGRGVSADPNEFELLRVDRALSSPNPLTLSPRQDGPGLVVLKGSSGCGLRDGPSPICSYKGGSSQVKLNEKLCIGLGKA